MQRTWVAIRRLGLAVLTAAGCSSTEPKLKPPPHPEVLSIAPQDDARYSKPPAYPEETLNVDPKKNKRPNSGGGPDGAPPTRFGAGPGPGMGGMGGMGGTP